MDYAARLSGCRWAYRVSRRNGLTCHPVHRSCVQHAVIYGPLATMPYKRHTRYTLGISSVHTTGEAEKEASNRDTRDTSSCWAASRILSSVFPHPFSLTRKILCERDALSSGRQPLHQGASNDNRETSCMWQLWRPSSRGARASATKTKKEGISQLETRDRPQPPPQRLGSSIVYYHKKVCRLAQLMTVTRYWLSFKVFVRFSVLASSRPVQMIDKNFLRQVLPESRNFNKGNFEYFFVG